MRLSELRRSERERAAVPSKITELGHPAALAFLAGKDLSRYAVTMTSLPKVGVNPRSKYNTPVGIYFYPAEYYVETLHNGESLPFQHGANYINIIELTTNDIMYLDDETEQNFERIVRRLLRLKIGSNNDDQEQYEKTVRYYAKQADSDAKVKTPGGKIWFLLYQVSRSIGELYHQRTRSSFYDPKTYQGYTPPPRQALAWNWLIRQMGYKVMIDPGTSVIHENEPNQGVIIDPAGTFRVVKRIYNISDPELKDKELLAFLNSDQATDADRIKAVNQRSNIFSNLQSPSEQVQIAAVEKYPWALAYIKTPSLTVQRIAVGKNPHNLNTLRKKKIPIMPELQELAVGLDSETIKYIDNPTEEIQLKAVEAQPDVIVLIPTATYRVKQKAVTKEPTTISLISDADFNLKKLAVSLNPYVFRRVKTTTPQERTELALTAVRNRPDSIGLMDDPPFAVQMAAVRRNGLVIIDIPKPSEAVQMAAVKQNPGSIFRILGKQIMPSEAVQIAAVSADPSILELLQQEIKPSLKVMQAAGQTG